MGNADTDTAQVEQTDTAPDEAETPEEPNGAAATAIWTGDTVPAPDTPGAYHSYRVEGESYAVKYDARYNVENDVGRSELETYLATLTDAGFVLDVSLDHEGIKYYEYAASAANGNATVDIEFEWYEYAPDTYNADDTETAAFRVFVYIE